MSRVRHGQARSHVPVERRLARCYDPAHIGDAAAAYAHFARGGRLSPQCDSCHDPSLLLSGDQPGSEAEDAGAEPFAEATGSGAVLNLAQAASSDRQTFSSASGAAATASGAVLNLAHTKAQLQLTMLRPPAGSDRHTISSDSESVATGSGAVLNLAQAEAQLQLTMLRPPAGSDRHTISSDSEAAEVEGLRADNSQTGDDSAGVQSSPRLHSSGGSSAGTSSCSTASDSTASGSTASSQGGGGADGLAEADSNPAAAAANGDSQRVEYYVQRKDWPWFPNSELSVMQVSCHSDA